MIPPLVFKKNTKRALNTLIITIILGVLFSTIQTIEYYNSKFSLNNSTYGSSFFITTGFHGIHVLIGTVFIISTILSIYTISNSSYHFVSFDLRA